MPQRFSFQLLREIVCSQVNAENEVKTATVQIKRARAPEVEGANCPDDVRTFDQSSSSFLPPFFLKKNCVCVLC